MSVSRRSFVSGLAAAMGYLGLGPGADLFAQGRGQAPGGAPSPAPLGLQSAAKAGDRAQRAMSRIPGHLMIR